MARGKSGRFVKGSVKAKSEAVTARNIARGVKNQLAKNAEEIVKEDVPMLVSCGRRLVEMDTVATHLWCTTCDRPLSLRNMESETQYGCASILTVRCRDCLGTYKVPTSKKVINSKDGSRHYATNCKAALGCVDSGVGLEGLNKLLSTLNVPVLHQATFKRAHDFVAEYVVAAADQSCKDAIEAEKRLTLELLLEKGITAAEGSVAEFLAQYVPEEEETVDDPAALEDTTAPPTADVTPRKRGRSDSCQSPQQLKKKVPITVTFDYGWDKRGNGYQFNSHSGRGTLFGQLTNMVLGYKVMSTYCRKCAMGAERGDHDCVRNHDGTAKSMEPHAAVELCLRNQQFADAQVEVASIVADRDASTYAALQRETSHPIAKFVDLNHNTKGFNNKLYNLKKTSAAWLSADTIEYLKRCMNNAIKQNKNNVEGVRTALSTIVPHVYGEHGDCGDWCKAKSQPETYLYKNLPKMKPLSCPDFREKLEALIEEQAKEAHQLAACGSTQANECFNHMAVTRAPKSRHYAGTNALKTRVASAVLAKNVGATYTDKVCVSATLSPSASKYRQSIQRRIEYKRAYQQMPHVKRRRLQLKLKDRWQEAQADSSGGVTYASGMGTVMERAVAAATSVPLNITGNSWVPPPSDLHPACALVTVDLETTGLSADCEIIQIAATCGTKQYSAYMVPQGKINQRASDITGLKVVRGKLVQDNVALDTKPPRIVASEFLAFLKDCGQQVILVGHNIIRFDAPRVLRFIKSFGEPMEFCTYVHGLVDTLPLVRQGKKGRLELLASEFLVGDEWLVHKQNAHNALADCVLLDGLLAHFDVNREVLLNSVVTTNAFMQRQIFLKNRARLAKDLAVFDAVKVSKTMQNRMAEAGVTMQELRSVMLDKGTVGFGPCLGVQIDGKPRVTSNKTIVNKIATFVRNQLLAEGVQCPV